MRKAHVFLQHSHRKSTKQIDPSDDQTGNGVVFDELDGTVHGSKKLGLFLKGRSFRFGLRLGDAEIFPRSDSVKPLFRAVKQGRGFFNLPDMDFGRNDSLFVPFYGVQAATVPSLSRFARLGRAKVIAMVTRLTPSGYVAEITPVWPDYPSGDAEADTARMNAQLQAYIDVSPGQYYWVHKRFKTRPVGEASFYR